MHGSIDKFLMFRNRLEKVNRHISKLAQRQGISCYRIYDHDMPEFPLLIEKYADMVYVAEYKRKHGLTEQEAEIWMKECKNIIADILQVELDDIFFRIRKRKENRLDQYQKIMDEKDEFIVEENNLKFIVNLTDYLDTGLFLDHRITRKMVMERAAEKKVLNLFCYTGSFSVYAIAGGASKVDSVDLSKTYLQWTERNVQLNFPFYAAHTAIHADVLQLLKEPVKEKYDLIILDPPTFSNSKRMEEILDIQRDHVMLIEQCLERLNEGGSIYFSTNFSKFKLEAVKLKAASIKDITRATTPFDFEGKLKRFCYLIAK
jgi:23S rRNA (cytosine1962-C5)-methyltransferase